MLDWIFKKSYHGTERLDGKTAIVTGSNTGIGKETAREFYRRGAKVIMACRNISKAKEAAEDIRRSAIGEQDLGELVIRDIDLASFESIERCAKKILETEPEIHLLVNNAGLVSTSKELSEDGYELNFAVNYLGMFLFTLLLVPRILKSAPARIVIVSCKFHAFCNGLLYLGDINLDKQKFSNLFFNIPAYARSKFASILFAKELGKRLKGTGVTTYVLHPGGTDTNMYVHLAEERIFPIRVGFKLTRCFLRTPVQGTQTTLYCSLDPKLANETGFYYRDCVKKTPFLVCNAAEKGKLLWEESVKIVKLTEYNPFLPT